MKKNTCSDESLESRTPRARRGSSGRPRKRILGVSLVALVAFLSLGSIAPAATAADLSSVGQYELSVGGQVVNLSEGETAVFQMQSIDSSTTPKTLATNAVYPGDGTGTITVTASAGVYHWGIEMHIPVTSFAGVFHITDLTSGLSGGGNIATAFSGSAPTSKLHGHRYSGTITGVAYLLGVAVAKTFPNNTSYTYK